MIAAFLRLIGRRPREPRKEPRAVTIQRMIAASAERIASFPEGEERDAEIARYAELEVRLQTETDKLRTWG